MKGARIDTQSLISQIAEKLSELQRAEETYSARAADRAAASRAETEALNTLNAAQKEVDKLFDVLRDSRFGDWSKICKGGDSA